jgi:cysteine synthase
MDIRDGFVKMIGDTPLIRLRKALGGDRLKILGRPNYSIPAVGKDRAARFIVSGRRGPRPVAAGASSRGDGGQTGIGWPFRNAGASDGHRHPETQSQEKRIAALCGASCAGLPAVPSRTRKYVHVSQSLAMSWRQAIRPAHMGQPVRQRRNRGARGRHLVRDLGSDRRKKSTACLRGRHRRHAGRRRPALKARNPKVVTALADPWVRPFTTTRSWGSPRRWARRSPKGWARAA